ELLAAATLGQTLEVAADRSAHVVEVTLLPHHAARSRPRAGLLPSASRAEGGDPDDGVAAALERVGTDEGRSEVPEAPAQDVGPGGQGTRARRPPPRER